MAKKMDAHLALLRDPEFMDKFKTSAVQLISALEALNEKARYEPLEPHELDLLSFISEHLPMMLKVAEDGQLILGHVLFQAAVTQYFHLKMLAEQGNEEARIKYEKLRPGFEAIFNKKDNSDGSLN